MSHKQQSNRQTISFRQVLYQLKKDLIGKDSHRGVTLTYSWLANQFGHFALGFIPSLILASILTDHCHCDNSALHAALYVSGGWALFETFNFLGPLLAKHRGQKTLLFRPNYTFQPAWWNIGFDTLTDIMFFSLGAFSAANFLGCTSGTLEVTIVLGILLLPASYFWYVTKMYLQFADFPAQIRLGQWNNKIAHADKLTVQRFMQYDNTGQHLLIFGTKDSGKTALSIAIATEKSIRHEPCMYISAMKLFTMFFEPERRLKIAYAGVWTWRSISTLIIDDINPGEPVHKEFVRSATFRALLNQPPYAGINVAAMKAKNVIWVLGNDKEDENFRWGWRSMLEQIGVAKENIHCIHLTRPKANRKARRYGKI